jgi:formate hydrogenlyase transcriptional activator
LKKQSEILILQSLTTEFALVRDKEDLLVITRDKLRSLFGFGENGVAIINDDGYTMTPFLSEPDSISRTYREMLRKKYPLADGVCDRTLDSPEPVLFHLQEMADRSDIPEYFQIQLEGGASRIVMTRLCTGKTVIGLWGLTLTDKEPLSLEQLCLVKHISHLMATAVSNVLANEEIQRRQMERETLLSLSMDIASARTTDELLTLIRIKLKNLLGFTNVGMTKFNKEKMTFSPIMPDPQSTASGHPEYTRAYGMVYPVLDGMMFERAFASDTPIVFSLMDLVKRGNMPFYITIPYESGLKIMCTTRLCHRGEVVGFWLLYFEDEAAVDESRLRLIEGLANQLSVAISNINANEVIALNLQAVSHQKGNRAGRGEDDYQSQCPDRCRYQP